MDGQMEFGGREIVTIKSKWGDLDMEQLPDGLTRDDLSALSLGDEALCMVRFVVEDIGHSVKHDRQGVGTKPLTRKVTLKMLSTGFIVDAIDKADERVEAEAKSA